MKAMLGFLLSIGLIAGCDAFAAEKKFDSREIRKIVASNLEDGYIFKLAEDSFDAMFAKAEVELRKRNQAALATQLRTEWEDFGRELLMQNAQLADVGDHDPFSDWIAEWYAKLEAALGIPVMEATHLRDIWVMNYTLPVVFHPQESADWCLEIAEDDDCQQEYQRHFAGTKWQREDDEHADEILHHGFAGVVTYWAVYAGCSAAGGGFACGVAGTGAQFVMERYFAPRISDSIFTRVNLVDGCDGISCDTCACDECSDCEDCDHEDCECADCDHDAMTEDET